MSKQRTWLFSIAVPVGLGGLWGFIGFVRSFIHDARIWPSDVLPLAICVMLALVVFTVFLARELRRTPLRTPTGESSRSLRGHLMLFTAAGLIIGFLFYGLRTPVFSHLHFLNAINMPGGWLIEKVIDIGLLRDLGLRSRYPEWILFPWEYGMVVQWLLAGLIVGAVVRHKDVATRIGIHNNRTLTSTPVDETPHAQRQRVLNIIGRCLLIAIIVVFFSWNRMLDSWVKASMSSRGTGFGIVSDTTLSQQAQGYFIRAVCDNHLQEWRWVIFGAFCILAAIVVRGIRLSALDPESHPKTTGAALTLAMITVILLLLHPWYS